MPARPAQSAYGLTFRDLPRVAELAAGVARSAGPEVTICSDPDLARAPENQPIDEQRLVDSPWNGRVLALDRAAATATFFGPPFEPDMIAHPYLSPVAIAFNRWFGREVFHGGGFVTADRAWILLGPRTAGKSTLLAALAARGIDVLSDDVVVTDGTKAFRGPRCVDLRELPPVDGLRLTAARQGTRLRLRLPHRNDPVPLGGWLFLQWGPSVAAHRIGARELLARLAVWRSWRHLPSDPALLLGLAALPAWDLTRPQDWTTLDHVIDLIEATVR